MTLSRRIRAFAGVVMFLSVLPAAYLLGESRGARNAAGNTDDKQAKASEFQPIERLQLPPKKLNQGNSAPLHLNAGNNAKPCPWNVEPAPLGAGLDPGPFAALPGGDPFARMAQDMKAMQEQMDEMFGSMGTMDPKYRKLSDTFHMPGLAFVDHKAFDGDVEETESSYVLRYSLPGLDKASLKVSVENTTIKVSGGSSQTQGQASSSTLFSRMSSLPGAVDSASLKTEYKDGVLTITLKKQVPGTPRNKHATSGASFLN